MILNNTFPFGIFMLASPIGVMLASLETHAKADDKDFSPIIEAKMPKGFPKYTPVGDVQIKQYPAYRKAQTDAKSGRAFWKLFYHIKKNKIAMTVPVEMSYSNSEDPRQDTMAFLYGNAEMGSLGKQKSVQVIDVPPMQVISTGVRGPRTTKSVGEARDKLEAWLKENEDSYAAAGELRVMSYNSPFVPRSRNYFEVEIPIRTVEKKSPP